MNNQIPYFFPPIPNQNINDLNNNQNIDHILNKINRLEKDIRIIENRLNKLENNNNQNNNYRPDDSGDMYII